MVALPGATRFASASYESPAAEQLDSGNYQLALNNYTRGTSN